MYTIITCQQIPSVWPCSNIIPGGVMQIPLFIRHLDIIPCMSAVRAARHIHVRNADCVKQSGHGECIALTHTIAFEQYTIGGMAEIKDLPCSVIFGVCTCHTNIIVKIVLTNPLVIVHNHTVCRWQRIVCQCKVLRLHCQLIYTPLGTFLQTAAVKCWFCYGQWIICLRSVCHSFDINCACFGKIHPVKFIWVCQYQCRYSLTDWWHVSNHRSAEGNGCTAVSPYQH